MKRWGSLVMIVLLGACGGDDGGSGDDGPGNCGTDTPSTAGEPSQLSGIVAAHNNVRCETGAGLPDLTWDDTLAQTAAAWIAMCRDTDAPMGLIDHNPNRGNNVGENVFGSSGGATGVGAVGAWASELEDYDYDSNGCSGVCGHYTQIVWGTTTKVGCAIGTCPGLTYGSSVVCNYSPAGNVSGQKPY